MSTSKTGSYRSLEKAFLDDLLAHKKAAPMASLLVLGLPVTAHASAISTRKLTPGLMNIHF